MFDLGREILQVLRNNKLRTSLTGLAVSWGIFMLIILLGVSQGVYNSFNENSVAVGSKISIYNGYTSIPYNGLKENRFIKITKNDMSAIAHENPRYVSDVVAELVLSGNTASTHDYVNSNISGVYPQFSVFSNIKTTEGRFINHQDIIDRRKVIVLSKSAAEILFPDNDAYGSYVTFKDLAFKVVGIYNKQGENVNYIPLTTALQLNGNDGKVSSIAVITSGLDSEEKATELENGIRETLAKRHTFDPTDKSAVWIFNQFIQQLTMLKALDILRIAVWLIGILTLLTGIVGVSNIMFVSVKERTHEIGIRRAIGAKPRTILTQIILESIAVTTLFGYIGVFFGICVTEIMSVIFSDGGVIKNPTVDINTAISVTLVLIVAGSIAGLFPAMKALKVKPVEALRTE